MVETDVTISPVDFRVRKFSSRDRILVADVKRKSPDGTTERTGFEIEAEPGLPLPRTRKVELRDLRGLPLQGRRSTVVESVDVFAWTAKGAIKKACADPKIRNRVL